MTAWIASFAFLLAAMIENGFMLCSGTQRIATVGDFKKSLDERIQIYDSVFDRYKAELLADFKCPNCGNELAQRKGKYGEFIGCSNYPHCRFTASIDHDTGELITKA